MYFTIFVQDFNTETGSTPMSNSSWWSVAPPEHVKWVPVHSINGGKGKHTIKIKEHKVPRYLASKPQYSLYVNMCQRCLCKTRLLSWRVISKGNTCFKLGPRIHSCILKSQHKRTCLLGCDPHSIWKLKKENISRQMCMNQEILFCS